MNCVNSPMVIGAFDSHTQKTVDGSVVGINKWFARPLALLSATKASMSTVAISSQKASALPSLNLCMTKKKEPVDLAGAPAIFGHADAGNMPISLTGYTLLMRLAAGDSGPSMKVLKSSEPTDLSSHSQMQRMGPSGADGINRWLKKPDSCCAFDIAAMSMPCTAPQNGSTSRAFMWNESVATVAASMIFFDVGVRQGSEET